MLESNLLLGIPISKSLMKMNVLLQSMTRQEHYWQKRKSLQSLTWFSQHVVHASRKQTQTAKKPFTILRDILLDKSKIKIPSRHILSWWDFVVKINYKIYQSTYCNFPKFMIKYIYPKVLTYTNNELLTKKRKEWKFICKNLKINKKKTKK